MWQVNIRRLDMETSPELLALNGENPSFTGRFYSQRAINALLGRVLENVSLNELFNKNSSCRFYNNAHVTPQQCVGSMKKTSFIGGNRYTFLRESFVVIYILSIVICGHSIHAIKYTRIFVELCLTVVALLFTVDPWCIYLYSPGFFQQHWGSCKNTAMAVK